MIEQEKFVTRQGGIFCGEIKTTSVLREPSLLVWFRSVRWLRKLKKKTSGQVGGYDGPITHFAFAYIQKRSKRIVLVAFPNTLLFVLSV